MSPEAQRIAIAEACGWKQHPYNRAYGSIGGDSAATGNPAVIWPDRLPDYLNDLNAMHEAEKTLNHAGPEWQTYKAQIWARGPYDNTHATAAQRAEAFLRTVGKWDDAK